MQKFRKLTDFTLEQISRFTQLQEEFENLNSSIRNRKVPTPVQITEEEKHAYSAYREIVLNEQSKLYESEGV